MWQSLDLRAGITKAAAWFCVREVLMQPPGKTSHLKDLKFLLKPGLNNRIFYYCRPMKNQVLFLNTGICNLFADKNNLLKQKENKIIKMLFSILELFILYAMFVLSQVLVQLTIHS